MEERKDSPRAEDAASPEPISQTLTREGSLQPQWMQHKASGGNGHSGNQSASRPRFIPEQRRAADSDRWTHGDDNRDLEHNETDSAKGRGGSMEWREEGTTPSRSSKWVTDERETWKTKERWAAGPDANRRWVDAGSTRHQRDWNQDGISRSYGDRWNTDGGRWTEERPKGEHDYVPKNSRWNDEERDRWRPGGASNTPGPPGAGDVVGGSTGGQRTDQSGAKGPQGQSGRYRPPGATNLARRSMEIRQPSEPGGEMAGPRSGIIPAGRYSKKSLLDIYDTLLQKPGSKLPIPEGADMTYPGILKSEYEQPHACKKSRDEEDYEESGDEVGEESEEAPAAPPAPKGPKGIGKAEIDANVWLYKDPEGRVQGPFGRNELIGWWEEGYFPEDFPIKSALDESDNWFPLKELLNLWRPPPGFGGGAQKEAEGAGAGIGIGTGTGVGAGTGVGVRIAIEQPQQQQQAAVQKVAQIAAGSLPNPGAAILQSRSPVPDASANEPQVGSVPSPGSWQQPNPLHAMLGPNAPEHPFTKVQQSLDALSLAGRQGQQARRMPQGLNLGPLGGAGQMPSYGHLQGGNNPAAQQGHPFSGVGSPPVRPGGLFPPNVAAQLQGLAGQQERKNMFQLDQPQQVQDSLFHVDLGMEQRNPLGMNHRNNMGMEAPQLIFPNQRPGLLTRPDVILPEHQGLLHAMSRNPAQQGHLGLQSSNALGGGLQRLIGDASQFGLPLPQQQAQWQHQQQQVSGLMTSNPAAIQAMHAKQLGLLDPRQGQLGGMGLRPSQDLLQHTLLSQGQRNAIHQLAMDPQVAPPPQNIDASAAPARPGIMGLGGLGPFAKMDARIPLVRPSQSQVIRPSLGVVQPPSAMLQMSAPVGAGAVAPPASPPPGPIAQAPPQVPMSVAPHPQQQPQQQQQPTAQMLAEQAKKGPVWGGPKPTAATSLRAIQEQQEVVEQAKQAAASKEIAAIQANVAAPAGRGAGWNAPAVKAKSLKDIMEETAQTELRPRVQPRAPAVVMPGNHAQGMADVGRSGGHTAPKWGSLANKPGTNLRDVLFKDSAGSAEGGRGRPEAGTPARQQQSSDIQHAAHQKKQAKGEDGADDAGAWQHPGGPPAGAQPAPSSGRKSVPKSSTPTPGGAARRGAPNSARPAPAAAKLAANAPRGNSVSPQSDPEPHAPAGVETGLFTGQFQISQQFKNWCQQQMMNLAGNNDMALIEFLFSLKGRTEVVEYIQMYFKKAPKEKVANFTREFMIRKEGDVQQIVREGQESRKSKGQGNTEQGDMGEPIQGAKSRANAQPAGSEASGWEKVKPKTAKPAKIKGKKSGKGGQMQPDLLRFRSNVNFDVLYKGNDD